MLGLSGFAHVSFTVRDLERSRTFYSEVLGLEHEWDLEKNGYKKAIFRDHASGMVLSLTDHLDRASGDEFSEFRTGLDHIAWVVPSFSELEQWRDRFEEHGVPHTELIRTRTGAVVMFRDPDNFQLEMYAPSEEWKNTEGWAFAFPPQDGSAHD